MLFYCCPTVFDVVPTLKQHWLTALCLLTGAQFINNWIDIFSMVGV